MGWNQNETGESGRRQAEGGRRKAVGVRGPAAAHHHSAIIIPQSAFTLTELLVVITIIAILASLITGAAINALNRAKQAAITLEIQQLGNSLEDFKNTYGAYPPNAMNPGTGVNNTLGNPIWEIVESDFVLMFRKAFPRHQEPRGLILHLAGNTNTGLPGNPTNLPGGMNAAEALVFWLGGFSADSQYPISGPGGPSFQFNPLQPEELEGRNRRYEFDLGRLGPRDSTNVFSGNFIEYEDPRVAVNPPTRRINLWRYTPSGSQQPLVYIDVSRHKPAEYDMHALGTPSPDKPMIHALEKLREGFSGTPGINDLVFVNQGKFQILHAGLDDIWGSFMPMSLFMQGNATTVTRFPEGPFLEDVADTVGNFMTGTLADEQE